MENSTYRTNFAIKKCGERVNLSAHCTSKARQADKSNISSSVNISKINSQVSTELSVVEMKVIFNCSFFMGIVFIGCGLPAMPLHFKYV